MLVQENPVNPVKIPTIQQTIPLFKVFMAPNVEVPLADVLHSGYIGQGPKVDEFEQQLRDWFNIQSKSHGVVTVNSGTAAEHLALRLLSNPHYLYDQFAIHDDSTTWSALQPGDEVLATPLTCTASNWPILANGYRIKWVDVDPNTMNMDLDDLARKITPKTKAIMAVHWGGYPIDLDKLKSIQDLTYAKFGFRPAVIEDCAHSFGSTYKGKKLGNHGNFCTFSFQAIKHFTTVDGGMLVTPNQALNKRAKLIRWYGIDREGERKDFRCEDNIAEWGYKFHMNDVNATIGMTNLPHAQWIVQQHQQNAAYYFEHLKNVAGVKLLENKNDRESAAWLFTMRVERRDDFMAYMKEKNIMVSRVHERNDKHSCVKEFDALLPNLEMVSQDMICIPVGWWVTPEQRQYIVDCIKQGW